MDMNQLSTFIAVADCGSFSKAAQELYVSSTAVMKQINMLEKQVGVKLLERTNRGVILTDAGRSFYHDARDIIKSCEEAVSRAKNAGRGNVDVIRIGSSILYPGGNFIELWTRMSDKYPQFKIRVVPFIDEHTNIPRILKNLGTGGFDLIIGACNSNKWLSICDFYEMGFCEICCAVSVDHRLASKKVLKIEDLYGETLMMIQRGDSDG